MYKGALDVHSLSVCPYLPSFLSLSSFPTPTVSFPLPVSFLRLDFAPPRRLEKLLKVYSFIPMSGFQTQLILQGLTRFQSPRRRREGRDRWTGRRVLKKRKWRAWWSSRGMREREQRRIDGSQRVVCDSPSSAGEQRKDEQVINTAGCHPSALESFSYALPLNSAELHTMGTIHWPDEPKCKLTTNQQFIYCAALCRVIN